MKAMRVTIFTALTSLLFLYSASCATKNERVGLTAEERAYTPDATLSPESKWNVDFTSFTYPTDCTGSAREAFTLRTGSFDGGNERVSMEYVRATYGDVTGDGQSEAIVVLDLITGGSAIPKCVYVFSRGKGGVESVSEFYSGDRADGGLRAVYPDSGRLILERYSVEESLGDCCPKYFLRQTYQFSSRGFEKIAETKMLNPNNGASFVH